MNEFLLLSFFKMASIVFLLAVDPLVPAQGLYIPYGGYYPYYPYPVPYYNFQCAYQLSGCLPGVPYPGFHQPTHPYGVYPGANAVSLAETTSPIPATTTAATTTSAEPASIIVGPTDQVQIEAEVTEQISPNSTDLDPRASEVIGGPEIVPASFAGIDLDEYGVGPVVDEAADADIDVDADVGDVDLSDTNLGNPVETVESLKNLGYTIEDLEPHNFAEGPELEDAVLVDDVIDASVQDPSSADQFESLDDEEEHVDPVEPQSAEHDDIEVVQQTNEPEFETLESLELQGYTVEDADGTNAEEADSNEVQGQDPQ